MKWPGGKFRLINRLRNVLLPGKRLIEPFTGSGAVFLNIHCDNYLLGDANPDLINLYQQLVSEGEPFIRYCKTFFTGNNNCEEQYYAFRDKFNSLKQGRRKSALFLYLNRHCYNGLCRYNSLGKFNTPFGRYSSPYFPEKEMRHFINAAEKATFAHSNFHETMQQARAGDVIYCDPPYVPLTSTAYFTDYHVGGFNWEDQILLAQTAESLATRNIKTVISNHDTKEVRKLYKKANATLQSFQVQRNISCNPNNREKVGELLAIFG